MSETFQYQYKQFLNTQSVKPKVQRTKPQYEGTFPSRLSKSFVSRLSFHVNTEYYPFTVLMRFVLLTDKKVTAFKLTHRSLNNDKFFHLKII